MKPLLIKGGQENWNARKIFNLDYFRKIYPIGSEVSHILIFLIEQKLKPIY